VADLEAGRAHLSDPDHWFRGGWADPLDFDRVCLMGAQYRVVGVPFQVIYVRVPSMSLEQRRVRVDAERDLDAAIRVNMALKALRGELAGMGLAVVAAMPTLEALSHFNDHIASHSRMLELHDRAIETELRLEGPEITTLESGVVVVEDRVPLAA
jgi:hypothetical protein